MKIEITHRPGTHAGLFNLFHKFFHSEEEKNNTFNTVNFPRGNLHTHRPCYSWGRVKGVSYNSEESKRATQQVTGEGNVCS